MGGDHAFLLVEVSGGLETMPTKCRAVVYRLWAIALCSFCIAVSGGLEIGSWSRNSMDSYMNWAVYDQCTTRAGWCGLRHGVCTADSEKSFTIDYFERKYKPVEIYVAPLRECLLSLGTDSYNGYRFPKSVA